MRDVSEEYLRNEMKCYKVMETKEEDGEGKLFECCKMQVAEIINRKEQNLTMRKIMKEILSTNYQMESL